MRLLLSCCLFIFLTSFKEAKEGKNIFESSVYEAYRKNISLFLSNHPLFQFLSLKENTALNEGVLKLAEIEPLAFTNPVEARKSHEEWLKRVRSLLELSKNDDDPNNQASKNLLKELIRWLYTENSFFPEASSFFYRYAKMDEATNFLPFIKESEDLFLSLSQFNGTQKYSKAEDQFLNGNLLSYVTSVKIGKNNIVLTRFGQPLVFSAPLFWWWIAPSPSQEFESFILQQKRHLYVNLMKRQGIEGPLTKKLESLEKDYQGFYLVSLDKNSSFYWQKDSPDKLEKVEAFKEKFLEHLTESNGAYYWSEKLDKHLWKKELKNALKEIQNRFFQNKEFLDKAERKDFIELTYIAILDKLALAIQPESMNITCRQAMDRGPSLMALWLYEKKALKDEELAVWLLTPPLLIHNRAGQKEKIDRFLSAAKRINQKS